LLIFGQLYKFISFIDYTENLTKYFTLLKKI
jgi:hypothetical protein